MKPGDIGNEWFNFGRRTKEDQATDMTLGAVCCNMLDFLWVLAIQESSPDLIDQDHINMFVGRFIAHKPHLDTHVQSLRILRLQRRKHQPTELELEVDHHDIHQGIQ